MIESELEFVTGAANKMNSVHEDILQAITCDKEYMGYDGEMRKIGGHVSMAGGLWKAVENTEKIGGNCLQIFAGSPRMWRRRLYSKDEVSRFNQMVGDGNLRPVFIHALYLVNLGSDNDELVKKSYQSLLMDLKNGQLIGAEGVVVHIGSHQGRGFDSAKNQIIANIEKLLAETEETRFLIENTACSHGKIGTLEEVAEIIERVPDSRLGMCLDSAHLFEAGWDIRQKEVVEQLIDKLEKLTLLDRIMCLHLNDSKTKLDSRHDVHANLGEGEIGLVGLANLVCHPRLKTLPLILEVPGIDRIGPDKTSIEVAKSLIEDI